MSSGPFGTPPESPPPSTPSAGEGAEPTSQPPVQPPAQPPVQPPMQPPPAQPPAYAQPEMPPMTAYPPPPTEPPMGMMAPAPMMAPAAPAPKRGLGALIAIVVLVLVVLVGVGGYVLIGNSYASSKVNAAQDAYNTAVGHQNAMNDTFNLLGNQFSFTDPSTGSADGFQHAKTIFQQLVDEATGSLPQIASDDSALVAAQSGLKQSTWLTTFSRSSLDRWSTKLDHARAALALAKTINTDLGQWGSFFVAFSTAEVDYINLGSITSTTSATTVLADIQALTTDSAKAKSLDTAPGLPTEVDSFVSDFVSLGNDFEKLFNDAASGGQSLYNTDLNNIKNDVTKLISFNFTTMGTEMSNFYQPLLDQYNAEVHKANQA